MAAGDEDDALIVFITSIATRHGTASSHLCHDSPLHHQPTFFATIVSLAALLGFPRRARHDHQH